MAQASILATSAQWRNGTVVPLSRDKRDKLCSGLGAFCGTPLRANVAQYPKGNMHAHRPLTRASVIQSLPKEFGLVVLTAVASAILTQWQAIEVARQRVKAGIKYPKMYDDNEDSVFNCYQRAHQNTLENYPAFLALLLIGGYAYPIAASVCGMAWVIGRVFYSLGYYTGEPKNRLKGMWSYFGLYGLVIVAAIFGVRQLL